MQDHKIIVQFFDVVGNTSHRKQNVLVQHANVPTAAQHSWAHLHNLPKHTTLQMSESKCFTCDSCGRNNFITLRGLRQHHITSSLCAPVAAQFQPVVAANPDASSNLPRRNQRPEPVQDAFDPGANEYPDSWPSPSDESANRPRTRGQVHKQKLEMHEALHAHGRPDLDTNQDGYQQQMAIEMDADACPTDGPLNAIAMQVDTPPRNATQDCVQMDISPARHQDQNMVLLWTDSESSDDEGRMQKLEEQNARSRIAINNWRKYCAYSEQHRVDFLPIEVNAIQLMATLLKKKASLDTYNTVMEWHLRATGKLKPHQKLKDGRHVYISRKKLMKKLAERYNMDYKNLVQIRELILPCSKTKVDIVYHNARDCVVSLLTDPRFRPEDYLFFGREPNGEGDPDPFAPPPDKFSNIKDINTGLTYTEMYKKYIKDPTKQILVPTPLYEDGAVTGQFDKLKICPLKMTLGIFNYKARDKEYAWRTLGYVPNYTKETSLAKTVFRDSGHIAAAALQVKEGEGTDDKQEDDYSEMQDYHAIQAAILKSLVQLQKDGMVWDFYWEGKLYQDIELVFYVPHMLVDNEEADKACGKYGCRTGNVSNLCRYCCCPTYDSANQFAEWPYKTPTMIQALVDTKNLEALKNISQKCITNAFYPLRIGCLDRGIHHATPVELLHSVLLGHFLRMRDCFFEQMSKDKKGVTRLEINTLAICYGGLFARQSERNLPKTKFAKGIGKGKIMAKEFTGVLLLMAVICHSTAGKAILKRCRSKKFSEDYLIDDWVLLTETLLQWEAYLKEPEMDKKDLERLRRKHQYIMYLMKMVGNRTEGMGFRTTKFHTILHIVNDILYHGPPMIVDTGSNESHHKLMKIAAKMTQKIVEKFERQVGIRMQEFHTVDLALEEIRGRALWDYQYGHYPVKAKAQVPTDATNVPAGENIAQNVPRPGCNTSRQPALAAQDSDSDTNHPGPSAHDSDSDEDKTWTGGTKFQVWVDDNNPGEIRWNIPAKLGRNRKKRPELREWDEDILHFLVEMQQKLKHWTKQITICSEHHRSGLIFRGHPDYKSSGQWNDWVIVKWGPNLFRPAEIWCFLDLTRIPTGVRRRIGGTTVGPGVYAVVEHAEYVESSLQPKSELFRKITKETTRDDDGALAHRNFYLVDVEAIADCCCVVPNVGAEDKDEYFVVQTREKWADAFTRWIRAPHHFDKMDASDSPNV